MTNETHGTRFVAPGTGATIKNLWHAACRSAENVRPADLSGLWSYLRDQVGETNRRRTNLALTGLPLTAEDLDRIAKCEVGR